MQFLNPELFDVEISVLINSQQILCPPIVYKYVNIKLDQLSPVNVLGGETITMKCSGIFNSVNKICVLKIGNKERLVELKYIDENTLTFVTPPLEWIKKSKYNNLQEEQEEVYEEEYEEEPQKNEEEKKDDKVENKEIKETQKVIDPKQKDISKNPKDKKEEVIENQPKDPKEIEREEMEKKINKMKIISIDKLIDFYYRRNFYYNHLEKVQVGFTLNHTEWYFYNDHELVYYNPRLLLLNEIPTNLTTNDAWKDPIQIQYDKKDSNDTKSKFESNMKV